MVYHNTALCGKNVYMVNRSLSSLFEALNGGFEVQHFQDLFFTPYQRHR